MSSFPLLYPEERDKGRCTKLIWLPQDESSAIDQQALRKAFPSARQILRGNDCLNKDRTVIIIDNPLNTDDPEAAGPRTNGITSHTIELPTGTAQTPKAGWYLCAGMYFAKAKRPALASAMDAYLRGIFSCGKFKPVFHHIAESKENPGMIVSIQGWDSAAEAHEYWDSKEHTNFTPATKDMMHMIWLWETDMMESKALL